MDFLALFIISYIIFRACADVITWSCDLFLKRELHEQTTKLALFAIFVMVLFVSVIIWAAYRVYLLTGIL